MQTHFIRLLFLVGFLTSLSAAERPNILFAIADDASYPHMSAYGTPWIETPGFDRVAKAGLLFHNAYTPKAKWAPSRACIITGRNSWLLEEAANHICHFPAKFKSYVEALGENGYFVSVKADLRQQLLTGLKEQGDPRMEGNGHIFDDYEYSTAGGRGFYERFMGGEKVNAGWVNPSDFEEGPLD